jgi:hypothetical protein
MPRRAGANPQSRSADADGAHSGDAGHDSDVEGEEEDAASSEVDDDGTAAWRVRFVTTDDHPIPDLQITYRNEKRSLAGQSRTADDGWADLVAMKGGSLILNAFPFVGQHAVRSARSVIRVHVLPLEVVLRDAQTGALRTDATVVLRNGAFRRQLAVDGDRFTTAVAPIVPGRGCWLALHVLPPEGRSGPATVIINSAVSRLARRMRIEIPLGPELRISLRAVDRDGYPVEGARVTSLWASGHVLADLRDVGGTTDRMGRLDLRRVPYFGRWAVVNLATRKLSGTTLVEFNEDKPLTVVLAPESDRAEVDEDVEEEIEEEDLRLLPPKGNYRVAVHCRCADGEPAPGVRVVMAGERWQRTAFADNDGVAVFEECAAVRCKVRVQDVAFLSPVVRVLPSTGTALIRESRGRDVRLEVHDENGQAYPLLQLRYGHARVIDGVQLEGAFTDLKGRARLSGVPIEAFSIGTEAGRVNVPANVPSHRQRLR